MKHGVERFVYLSTSDVYGLRDFHGETEEEAVRVPFVRNYYPRSKIFAGLKRTFRKDVLRSFGLSLRGETAIRRSRRALKDSSELFPGRSISGNGAGGIDAHWHTS